MSHDAVVNLPAGYPGMWGTISIPDQNKGEPDPKQPETFDMPFNVKGVELIEKQDGSTEGTFHGLASTFNNKDLQGDIILPGAFKSARASSTKMLFQHDSTQVIGVWEELAETERGLQVKGRLIMEIQKGFETFQLLKHKAIDALSIGFRIPNRKRDMDFDEETGVRRIKRVDLWEVSVVTFPANPKARISRVKDALADNETPDIRDLECALRDVGFTQSQAKRLLAEGYQGLVQRDVPEPPIELIQSRNAAMDRILNKRSV